jgi:hypothetical protein
MKKIISYSLWGNKKKYLIGALENARLAQEIYPDWISRFYIDLSITENLILQLLEFKNIEIIKKSEYANWSAMFWRFLPAIDPNIDIMISRDIDSRLSLREKNAVDEWLDSDKDFHIMRDHPYHNTAILGGMWGIRNNLFNKLNISIDIPDNNNFWQVDQNFLREYVYPKVIKYSFIHDSYNLMNEKNTYKFPTKRTNFEFVGEIYDEYNSRHPDHYTLL